ncbi:MAG: multicopper oxidase domain-containing protein [Taibaiella sp.]|nr:multicopper oxidase domain-containing protein [Taibaiella sp.]
MKLKVLFTTLLAFMAVGHLHAQYNPLWIPDTMVGTTFNLTMRDTFRQILTGNQTITGGINGNFWGPTMIWNKGDVITVNVNNQITDTTTIHWHGMHLPAIMDGGPHQPIPPFTTWSPYWKVDNNAALYWYHPHLHMMAEEQLSMGLGGMIIVRDPIESALALPRTYGVDDIPLALTDRKFDALNQFITSHYGDSMMTNGVVRAEHTIPAQVVRLRLLDAAMERSYNIGFSDGRTFYVITTDGGLVNAPVPVTRFLLSAGERVEILVNCTGQSGTTVDLRAYNSELTPQVPGGESFPGGPFANALGHANFNILHLNIGAATASPITTIPATLTTNTFYPESSAVVTRTVTISDSTVGPGGPTFLINHKLFEMDHIDYHVPLDNTEIWEIKSTSGFGHPFHIHDVEFHILTINGAAPPAHQDGWKDVVFIPANQTVRFIAKFNDYSDSLKPYMFHCHIALHEDLGMMGQFVVGNSPTGIMNRVLNNKMKLYPNPTKGLLYFEMQDNITITHATVINVHGQVVKEFELNNQKSELDVSMLNKGLYFLRLTDAVSGSYIKSYLME